MENPFEKEAQYWKQEAKSWSNRSKLVGIILGIVIVLSMFC